MHRRVLVLFLTQSHLHLDVASVVVEVVRVVQLVLAARLILTLGRAHLKQLTQLPSKRHVIALLRVKLHSLFHRNLTYALDSRLNLFLVGTCIDLLLVLLLLTMLGAWS